MVGVDDVRDKVSRLAVLCRIDWTGEVEVAVRRKKEEGLNVCPWQKETVEQVEKESGGGY